MAPDKETEILERLNQMDKRIKVIGEIVTLLIAFGAMYITLRITEKNWGGWSVLLAAPVFTGVAFYFGRVFKRD
jgi:hypothetical protein